VGDRWPRRGKREKDSLRKKKKGKGGNDPIDAEIRDDLSVKKLAERGKKKKGLMSRG